MNIRTWKHPLRINDLIPRRRLIWWNRYLNTEPSFGPLAKLTDISWNQCTMWDWQMLCHIKENKEKERRSDRFLALFLVETHSLRFFKPPNILPPVFLRAYGAFLPSRLAVRAGSFFVSCVSSLGSSPVRPRSFVVIFFLLFPFCWSLCYEVYLSSTLGGSFRREAFRLLRLLD